jgi:hypothetical protein
MMLTLVAAGLAAGLFAGMMAFLEVGRRFGAARLARDPEGVGQGAGPVDAAVFGLLGLLLAFTFSGAASRFEARRHLIKDEANAIGTAYLRVDLLPADTQPELRQLFRRYLDVRVETYRYGNDLATVNAKLAEGATLQGKIWQAAVAGCRRPEVPTSTPVLLLNALNEMIDITTTRVVATQNHPPKIIYVLLAALSLVSALLVGYVMCRTKAQSWLHMTLFAATMSVTLYVILDLEYPHTGLIRIDAADEVLIDVGNGMR